MGYHSSSSIDSIFNSEFMVVRWNNTVKGLINTSCVFRYSNVFKCHFSPIDHTVVFSIWIWPSNIAVLFLNLCTGPQFSWFMWNTEDRKFLCRLFLIWCVHFNLQSVISTTYTKFNRHKTTHELIIFDKCNISFPQFFIAQKIYLCNICPVAIYKSPSKSHTFLKIGNICDIFSYFLFSRCGNSQECIVPSSTNVK